ncbi:MAG: hypothetical protein H7328_03690 [Bdellovibrio sp.]|nr:hypothetical protein [Bdellovibrio sp.]
MPDQFLQSKSNLRTGDYDGSVANRARLLLTITDEAIAVWSSGRVGVYLSSLVDANPEETFSYVA